MHDLTVYVVVALYCIAIFFTLRLLRGKHQVVNNGLPFVSLVIVLLVLHMWLLHGKIFLYASPLISFSVAISMASWISVAFYLCISVYRKAYELGVIVLPVGLAGLLIEEVLPVSMNNATLLDPLLSWHVLIAIPAYGALCLAFAQAVFLSYQDRRLKVGLKATLSSSNASLPALQTMEENFFGLTLTGFVLLSVNFLMGLKASQDAFGEIIVFDHHTVFSIMAWFGFAALLMGRRVYGWRGKVAANSFIIVFGVLVLAYFGQRFVREFIL